MRLQLNGEQREFPDGLTVSALVARLGMKPDRVAVELNLEIVPRGTWDSVELKNGDKLEIVHFVGGGSGLEPAAAPDSGQPPVTAGENWQCPSCLSVCDGKFCPCCGEKRPSRHDLSIGHLLSHAAEIVFHWDSKIFRTFRVLFSKPGLLSAEYVAGRRKPYAHPFQVFFIANLLYFLVFPVLGWSGLKTPLSIYRSTMVYREWATRMAEQRAAGQGIGMEEFTRRFDHQADIHSRSLVFLVVPLFAAVLFGMEWRKRRYFGEHLVFALHFSALWMIAVFIFIYGGTTAVFLLLRKCGFIVHGGDVVDYEIYTFAGLVMAAWVTRALQRFYGDGRAVALGKALLFVASTIPVMQVFRFVLFLTALYSA
ncbi:MAG TPA: sulfur carrier protein ThiS [Candidatus Limnocylindrales bacterium]|nr:sulfur carrier protein ThiS [Candidatus Limnocylindrales bacterium]